MKAPFKHGFPSSSIWLSAFIPHTPTLCVSCGDKHVPCASGTKWRVGIHLHIIHIHTHMHINTHRCSVHKQVYWQFVCIDKDAVSCKSIVCQAESDSSSWMQNTHTHSRYIPFWIQNYRIWLFPFYWSNINQDALRGCGWQKVFV